MSRTKQELRDAIANSQFWIARLKAREGSDPNSILRHQVLIVHLRQELAELKDSGPATG